MRPRLCALAWLPLLLASAATAQRQSSSSSSSSSSQAPEHQAAANASPQAPGRPRVTLEEAGGAAVTLETDEALFQVAAALNACGYDAGLEQSEPVRGEIRQEMAAAAAADPAAADALHSLCRYVGAHTLADPGRNVAQYVSLALYLSPPPQLQPNVSELQLPPDSAQVINVLPLLRTWAAAINLHGIWVRHRAEYEAATAIVHDPMAAAILNVNIYLHQPVSSYDGRRFLVLIEPMLSPAETNGRIYANDYITVASPSPAEPNGVRIELIRHLYLHYVVEPMVYSRAAATDRLLPLLRTVADAPIDFQYKSDIVALLTECLIKAIEARMYIIAAPRPVKPRGERTRTELAAYDAQMVAYNRQTDVERLRLVQRDMSEGWTLTEYFANQLVQMEHNGDGLRDEVGPMIYGMEVDREVHRAGQVLFVKEHNSDVLRGSPRATVRPRTVLDDAEADLLKGNKVEAAALAEKAVADPALDHGRAEYVLAQVDLVSGEYDKAFDGFSAALRDTHDPRTLAWSHVYLGRLYDSMADPHRREALAEYRAALAVPEARPDVQIAAHDGISKPYHAGPAQPAAASATADDDKDFDPSGRKEKQAYQPDAPPK